jgi:hypothetical protein
VERVGLRGNWATGDTQPLMVIGLRKGALGPSSARRDDPSIRGECESHGLVVMDEPMTFDAVVAGKQIGARAAPTVA